MVNQVNNIIFNLIVSGRGVWLPDIAALRTVRRPAQAGTSSRTVLPPRLTVEFTSHREGVSLVEEIAHVASIDETAARDIYDRWIEKCLVDGILTIDGIGVLRGKSFVADNALTELLNADAGGEIKVVKHRRSHRLPVIVSAVLLLAAAAGALYWLLCRDMTNAQSDDTGSVEQPAVVMQPAAADAEEPVAEPSAAESQQEQTEETPIDGVQTSASDAEPDRAAAAETEASAAENDTAVSETKPAAESDIRYRVIIGSYSTRSNAERAVADALKRVPGLRCEIRPLGRLFAVAAFGAPTREECEEFIREHRSDFPQAWTNPARK
ncbi:MAG: hypothetical protein J6K38_06255 [Alistipes sp.]|nr:hypothetical protein [Alistipes sp.]